jgi:hypothetical protein
LKNWDEYVVTLSLNFFPGKALEIKEKGSAKTITT